MIFSKEWIWLKAHERLVIIGASLALLLVLYDKGINLWEKHDQRVYDAQKAKLQADVDLSKSQAAANAVLAQQYQDLANKVLAQNASLEQAISNRDASTRQQQVKDQTLPPSDLALRWQQLASLPLGSVNPTTVGFSATDAAARQTVQQLENVPRLEKDLQDVRTEAQNKDAQLAKQGEVVDGLKLQTDALQKQLADTVKADKAELNLVKVKARKGKLRWFLTGYVAGLLTKPVVTAFGL